MTSFQRQLNLYGFRRITKGENQGTYFHPKFQRGRKDLLMEIKRLPPKGSLPTIEEVISAADQLPSERYKLKKSMKSRVGMAPSSTQPRILPSKSTDSMITAESNSTGSNHFKPSGNSLAVPAMSTGYDTKLYANPLNFSNQNSQYLYENNVLSFNPPKTKSRLTMNIGYAKLDEFKKNLEAVSDNNSLGDENFNFKREQFPPKFVPVSAGSNFSSDPNQQKYLYSTETESFIPYSENGEDGSIVMNFDEVVKANQAVNSYYNQTDRANYSICNNNNQQAQVQRSQSDNDLLDLLSGVDVDGMSAEFLDDGFMSDFGNKFPSSSSLQEKFISGKSGNIDTNSTNRLSHCSSFEDASTF